MQIIVIMCRKDLPLSEGETFNCPLAYKNIPRDIIDIVVAGSKRYENSHTSQRKAAYRVVKKRETSMEIRIEESNRYLRLKSYWNRNLTMTCLTTH